MSTTYTSRPARTYTADDYGFDLAQDRATVAKYQRMLALATELGLEFEMERMGASVREFEREAQIGIDDAVNAGLLECDVEAAAARFAAVASGPVRRRVR